MDDFKDKVCVFHFHTGCDEPIILEQNGTYFCEHHYRLFIEGHNETGNCGLYCICYGVCDGEC